ncbi:MAG: glycine--tRNA ligase subunit beta [Syntrophomonadaceae bacterium]|jgi:glycyl-tRNA synthetase beta chain|nr:glycine--tRNA ligase subunit beta [Syntrophomonadaceae bacterium]
MVKDILLEIGVEEIPSAYMPKAIADLKDIAEQKLNKARLRYQSINTFGTPRRLTLLVKELDEKQEDALVENRGPKKSAAFDGEGNPSKAGLGFARSQGLDFKELTVREYSGVEYMYAIKKDQGLLSQEVLPSILTDIIQSLSFPKSMRWGYHQFKFARPIRWLTAIYDDQLIELKIENIESVMHTIGHRFLSNGIIELKNVSHYREQLKQNFVILNQQERKEVISRQIKAVAAEVGGEPMDNENLLDEITYLVEYPTAFYGSFNPSYLEVPQEVLTTSMIEHQRYFPVFDKEGKLMPGFIGVNNGTADNLDFVRAGNERVLKARLEDALFFWNEDLKKNWDEVVEKLDSVLFHEKLGSVRKKVSRLQMNTAFIAGQMKGIDYKLADRAAFLCKADLLSNMVYEFPELQGIMGRYYALKAGEKAEICNAIYEHYLPRFAGDELPSSPIGIVLSLAEKIDHLTSFFAIGIKPSGSQDPYALRRQAIGIATIILDKKPGIDLEKSIGKAYDNLADEQLDRSREEVISDVLDFIHQRLRSILQERGYSYDVIDAVFAAPVKDPEEIEQRIQAISNFKKSAMMEDFMVVYNRANNLSKTWESEEVEETVLLEETEIKLLKEIKIVCPQVKASFEMKDYETGLKAIVNLRPFIDAFFDQVMVMSPDPQLKASRLGMLKIIANLCNFAADFSKLV